MMPHIIWIEPYPVTFSSNFNNKSQYLGANYICNYFNNCQVIMEALKDINAHKFTVFKTFPKALKSIICTISLGWGFFGLFLILNFDDSFWNYRPWSTDELVGFGFTFKFLDHPVFLAIRKCCVKRILMKLWRSGVPTNWILFISSFWISFWIQFFKIYFWTNSFKVWARHGWRNNYWIRSIGQMATLLCMEV